MPTVTKSIGTNSRDYATITLWEADLDNTTPYDAGDVAVGECYDDSVFDEAFTINGGGTIGLASVKLSVASGERHDGTAGTGARIVRTVNGTIVTKGAGVTTVVEWLEVDANEKTSGSLPLIVQASTNNLQFARLIAHSYRSGTAGATVCISDNAGGRPYDILNCVIYDIACTTNNGQARGIGSATNTTNRIYNNTVHNIVGPGGTGNSIGIAFPDDADCIAKNNISTDTSGTGSGTIACFSPAAPSNATASHNAASDTSASGTGSLDSITTADQYVSTVVGSEDLHLKTGADCIDAGTDLGTTPSGVQFDIDGRDRDAEGDTWDIGADEFVAAPGGGNRRRRVLICGAAA